MLERLDPALGDNGTMKSGSEEVAQVVRCVCNTVYIMYVDTASYAYVQPHPHNRPIPFFLAFQCFIIIGKA